ncbi:MAG: protein O-mannosyl-transferase TMTC1-related protein, partial [Candidatus Latescibacterota bacterium]
MKKRKHSIRTLLLVSLALFAATWMLYANTLANRFAFDDKSLVTENRFLSQGASLSQIFTTNYRAGAGFVGDGLYRPVVMISYLWNKGETLEPFPFHLFNITANALNTVLLFFLLYAITGDVLFSSLAGVLFGFHPIHTEVVANVAGRPEILCVFFLLASWITLEKYPGRLWPLFPATLLFFAALLSKETAIVYPLMIPATDAVLKRKLISRDSVLKYLFLFGAVTAYLILRWKILGDTAAGLDPTRMDNPIAHSPFFERTATAFSVFVRYVYLLLFPVNLSADYSYNQLPIYPSLIHSMPALGLILLAGMTAAAFLFRKRSPLPLLALIIFIFPLLLVSNLLFPVGTIM